MLRRYSIYGLSIRSAIELDAEPDGELRDECPADVEIVRGIVPETLPEGRRYNALSEAAPGRLLLRMPRVARYLVEDGKRITVAPESGADDRALAVFTSASPLAAILHQQGRVCLSGCGIFTPKGAVLFTGPGAVGKSTLAAALSLRGFPVICDDIAALLPAENPWEVARGPSFFKLWPDSLRKLGVDAADLNPVRPGLPRRILPVAAPPQRSIPLAAVFSLRETRELRAERLSRECAISTLMEDTYLPRMRASVGSQWDYVLKIAGIVARTPCFSIRRIAQPFEVARLIDLTESLIASL